MRMRKEGASRFLEFYFVLMGKNSTLYVFAHEASKETFSQVAVPRGQYVTTPVHASLFGRPHVMLFRGDTHRYYFEVQTAEEKRRWLEAFARVSGEADGSDAILQVSAWSPQFIGVAWCVSSAVVLLPDCVSASDFFSFFFRDRIYCTLVCTS